MTEGSLAGFSNKTLDNLKWSESLRIAHILIHNVIIDVPGNINYDQTLFD